eukprot:gene24635-27855_t
MVAVSPLASWLRLLVTMTVGGVVSAGGVTVPPVPPVPPGVVGAVMLTGEVAQSATHHGDVTDVEVGAGLTQAEADGGGFAGGERRFVAADDDGGRRGVTCWAGRGRVPPITVTSLTAKLRLGSLKEKLMVAVSPVASVVLLLLTTTEGGTVSPGGVVVPPVPVPVPVGAGAVMPKPWKLLKLPPMTVTSDSPKLLLGSVRLKLMVAVSPEVSAILLLLTMMVGGAVSAGLGVLRPVVPAGRPRLMETPLL